MQAEPASRVGLIQALGGTTTWDFEPLVTNSQHNRFTVPAIAERFASLFQLRPTRLRAAIARSAVVREAFGPTTNSELCLFNVIPRTRKTPSGVIGRTGPCAASRAAMFPNGTH